MGRIFETSKRAYGRLRSICRSAKARIRHTKPVPTDPSLESGTIPDYVTPRPRPRPSQRSMASGVGLALGAFRPPSTPTSWLDESSRDKKDQVDIPPVAGFRLPSKKAQEIMQAHRLGQDHGRPVTDLDFQGCIACLKLNTSVYFRSNATIVNDELILKLDVAKEAINPSLKACLQIGLLDNIIPEIYLKFSKFCFDQGGEDSTLFIQYPHSNAEVRAAIVTNPETNVRDMRVTLWCSLGTCEDADDHQLDNNAGFYHDPALFGDFRTISPEESLYMKHFDDTSPSQFTDYVSPTGRILTGPLW
ncbi:hypothetical protein EMCG_05466 [[Emmonsia] crescens]|uniref:Uncharacterized protein n=1 Tax=[Emmonsia] crescens TaxID=73230 RepID=A0A0G2IXI5_9EURO|nr:hypothetical protein EMCG_05466 [Emmonsia crescens UAMH 3008]